MSAPLEFLKVFSDKLRASGIRFAITSGMACVHYGLQQSTKDSDWIVHPDDLADLRQLLVNSEGEMPPWRVAYRSIFGAPLEADFLRHGWTSHLSIWDRADSPEHKVDLFGRPPRVRQEECQYLRDGFAERHVVAQMKKTDRDKDWPMVDGLGLQTCLSGQRRGVLHLYSIRSLREAWRTCPALERSEYAQRRPLLAQLDGAIPDEPLERLLHVERVIWQCVNRERYAVFQRSWKDFYRRWQNASAWEWPTAEPFWMQHQRLNRAVQQHQLPPDPFVENYSRESVFERGLRRAASLTGASPAELALVQPPIQEILT